LGAFFTVMFAQHFFWWPDQWPKSPLADPLLKAFRLLRLQRFQLGEAMLLSVLQANPGQPDALALLAFIRLRQVRINDAQEILHQLQAISSSPGVVQFLQAQFWMQIGAIPQLLAQPQAFWQAAPVFWPLHLAQAAFLIHLNKLAQASAELAAIPEPWTHCLEAIRLRCRILERQQKYSEALEQLMPAVQRFPQHWPAQVHLVDLSIKARSQQHALPLLRRALAMHGPGAEIMSSVQQIQLLRNRGADARRTALQEQAWHSVRPVASVAATNLLNCYDRLGYVDWLAHEPMVSGVDSDHSLSLEMRENLCMQAASQELPQTSRLVSGVVAAYQAEAPMPQLVAAGTRLLPSKVSPCRPLTIAWITADLAYHPVSRFLLSFFAASNTCIHRHLLVDTCDHLSESNRGHFEAFPSVEVLNMGHADWPAKVHLIQHLQADIAIDLSGWTGGHFMRGFLARLAPLQISYLGYFASTGIPNMDVWLGDHQLFPTPMQEWHSEAIHRLRRCFIAWQPPAVLPEAGVDVVEAHPAGAIRFGSFNNNRKLSDATLRLWGELLRTLPEASLVLKASHRDDSATQELLCRRMRRQGLDPEQVIWLPRADGPVEHLQQYSWVDVALDCFPNGGCTTTCEALWMGTPVITLTGKSYVSRMSTAVLHGAAMPEWCARSPQHYLQLAQHQAARLGWLRQNRQHWRLQLQQNPLGDAAGLMAHLEEAFTAIAAASR
jgi:protein O-GlcNAc transferase